MVFWGYSGNVRTGKTLLMTIFNYYNYRKGINIFSNYHVKFAKLINALDMINFNIPPGKLLVDEIHTLIDARLNSQAGRYVSYFNTQSGKRDIDIHYTTQHFGMVDKRLRELTHNKIFCAHDKRKNIFRYVWLELLDNGIDHKIKKSFTLPESKAKLFYPLYDTKELIYAPDVSSESIMSYDELIDIYAESPTKASFKMILRKLNPYIGLDTAGAIYDYIKEDTPNGIINVKKLMGLK